MTAELNELWNEACRAIGISGLPTGERAATDGEQLSRVLSPRVWGSRAIGTIAVQWRVERFLVRRPSGLDPRVMSLALGLCQQALRQRLPEHTEADFARWLAAPALAPRRARPTVERLLALQRERDELSSSWKGTPTPQDFAESDATQGASREPQTGGSSWRVLAVCVGDVEGVLWFATQRAGAPLAGTIRVFDRAGPETVHQFDGAAAIVFIRGGVLSHACSIARERGIPCVTGLGDAGYAALSAHAGRRVRVESRAVGDSRISLIF